MTPPTPRLFFGCFSWNYWCLGAFLYVRKTLKCAARRGPDYFLLIGAAAIFLGISIIAGIVYTYADIRYAQADSFLGIHDFPADL
jgi:hypothetical protein